MKLLVILLGLAVEHFLGPIERLRRWEWFHGYARWARSTLTGWGIGTGAANVVGILALPLVAVWLLHAQLADMGWLFGLLFALVVVLYSLGPRDLHQEVQTYLRASAAGDAMQAGHIAKELAGGELDPARPAARQVAEAVLVRANERVFAALFWFVALGPLGAALYRLASELKAITATEPGAAADSAAVLDALLGWIPARLLALGYALSGSLTHALDAWRVGATLELHANEQVLREAGMGALAPTGEPSRAEGDEVVEATVALVRRAFWIWLTVLAIATLGNWVG